MWVQELRWKWNGKREEWRWEQADGDGNEDDEYGNWDEEMVRMETGMETSSRLSLPTPPGAAPPCPAAPRVSHRAVPRPGISTWEGTELFPGQLPGHPRGVQHSRDVSGHSSQESFPFIILPPAALWALLLSCCSFSPLFLQGI